VLEIHSYSENPNRKITICSHEIMTLVIYKIPKFYEEFIKSFQNIIIFCLYIIFYFQIPSLWDKFYQCNLCIKTKPSFIICSRCILQSCSIMNMINDKKNLLKFPLIRDNAVTYSYSNPTMTSKKRTLLRPNEGLQKHKKQETIESVSTSYAKYKNPKF